MKVISAIIVGLFFVFNAQNVLACMCGHTSISDAYAEAGAVVNAVVEKVETNKNDQSKQSITLRIAKSYKGTKSKTVNLIQENSNCDWWFKDENVGKSYLFYLGKLKSVNNFTVISCGRSSEISDAVNDLSWLDGLPKSLNRTRISGVTQIKSDEGYPPLANIKLEIVSKDKKYEVVTDRNGLYEIWDVSAGVYSVFPIIPNDYVLGWTTSVPNNWIYFWNEDSQDKDSLKVDLQPKSSGGVDFMFKRKK